MAEAESFDKETEDAPQDQPMLDKKKGRQEKQKQRIERAQNGRGGALTAVKTQPKKTANPRIGIFSWLGPNVQGDDKKAKQEDNVLQKSSSKKEETKTINNATTATTTGSPDLAKLWWVNVWTQQLPDRPDFASKENTTCETRLIPLWTVAVKRKSRTGREPSSLLLEKNN